MHTYLHACIPTYMHTYIPTYIHTYIHTYILQEERRRERAMVHSEARAFWMALAPARSRLEIHRMWSTQNTVILPLYMRALRYHLMPTAAAAGIAATASAAAAAGITAAAGASTLRGGASTLRGGAASPASHVIDALTLCGIEKSRALGEVGMMASIVTLAMGDGYDESRGGEYELTRQLTICMCICICICICI